VTSNSGTILLSVPIVNDTLYFAEATVNYNNDTQVVAALNYEQRTINPFGVFGLLAVVLLTIVFAFVGYFSISIMLILAPLPLLFASIMQVVNISVPICIVIEILAISLAIIIKQ
jgi:hypothetical protein